MNKNINNNLKAVSITFAIIGILSGLFGFANLAEAQCGGSTCGEVPLTCSPQHQTGQVGTSFNFTAEGGDGNFSWSAPGSNVRSGSAQNFSTSYSSTGYKTVYVTSGTQTKTCAVTVDGPVIETHKACVNNACTIVSGPGPNTCYTNSDCVVLPPPPPSCDFVGALTGNITSVSGAQSYATVTNNSSCTKTVTFAAYRIFIEPGNPGWLDTQVLNDHQTVTLSANQTQQLTVNNASCRTQLDVYEGQVQPHLSDAAGGFPGQNLLDYDFTSDPLCGVTPPTLTCSPANQTVNINGAANFSAAGGTGTYSWSAFGGNPASGSSQNFSTSYSSSGTKTVTVTSGNQTATCNVAVNPPTELPLSCNPANQSVNTNSPANFSASGGNGTYSWSTNVGSDSGNPASGTGINFTTAYSTAGYKTVTVSSGSQTVACHVTVNEPPQNTLTCNPQNQSVYINSSANFSATGGTGTYNWSAGDGSPSTGVGSSFSTTYGSVGARTVTVSSGNQTATCNVIVNTQPQQTLTCNPQSQSGNVWSNMNFSATGGNGSYNWYASDGNPTSGTGSNFSTQYSSSGFRTVIVTSNGQTATCNVTINQQPQNNLACIPQNQTANVNDLVSFSATGGSGTYSWSAYDAQISYGSSQNFSTRFNSVGFKNVTVTSNGQTATCYVNVNAISGNNTYFQITKNVLNKTLNQTAYVNSIEAQSADLLEFEIRIRNNGNTSAEVNLKDLLPTDLNYVYGSATNNGYYLNDSVMNYGVSLGNLYPGEEKVVRLRATVRLNAPAVTITNQAVATMNSNTQNAFATIQLRNRGQVLGAADIVTGPEDVMPWALSLGFMASSIIYFYFFYSRPERRRVSLAAVRTVDVVDVPTEKNDEPGILKAVMPKKELDVLISALKKAETSPDS